LRLPFTGRLSPINSQTRPLKAVSQEARGDKKEVRCGWGRGRRWRAEERREWGLHQDSNTPLTDLAGILQTQRKILEGERGGVYLVHPIKKSSAVVEVGTGEGAAANTRRKMT